VHDHACLPGTNDVIEYEINLVGSFGTWAIRGTNMNKTLAAMAITAALAASGAQAQTYMWPAPPAPSATPTI